MRIKQTLIIFTMLTAVATAAPQDPTVPLDGFPIDDVAIGQTLTYTDGYQTYFDLRTPDVTGPANGWPLVLIVHGGGGSKDTYTGTAEAFAKVGYATLTYDVRGQGTAMVQLNDPTLYGKTRNSLREIFDIFELLEGVEAAYPAEIDFDRIGITGFSQGGITSWNAAVHAGTNPPANLWGRVAPFPSILAAVPQGCGGPTRGTTATQTVFGVKTVEGVFGTGGGIHFDPTTQATLEAAVLAEDYSAFQNLTSSGVFDEQTLLAQTQVPIYFYASYDDPKVRSTAGVTAWEALTSAKRMQLGTGHHGCPANRRDDHVFRVNRRLWFNRFLKSEMNGVENGPAVVAATTPEDIATYNALASNRDFRRMSALDDGVTTERLYVTTPGLQATPPAIATQQTVVHTPPGFVDIAWWTTNLPTYPMTLATIPLSTVAWDSTILDEDRHLIGQVDVHLQLVSNQAEYQLNVAILDVGPFGNSRMVTKRDFTERANVPGATNTVDLQLDVQSYVFRAGHRIRIQFENLARRDTDFSGGDRLKRLPLFSPFTIDIVSGPGSESWIDLPVLPFASPVLSMYPIEQHVSALETQSFTIHSDSSHIGDTYVLLVSGSGSSPGVTIAGVQVPINPDFFTDYALANLNLPPYLNTFGSLAADGSASPMILMPASIPPVFSGFSFHFAAAVVSPSGVLSVTEGEEVRF